MEWGEGVTETKAAMHRAKLRRLYRDNLKLLVLYSGFKSFYEDANIDMINLQAGYVFDLSERLMKCRDKQP